MNARLLGVVDWLASFWFWLGVWSGSFSYKGTAVREVAFGVIGGFYTWSFDFWERVEVNVIGVKVVGVVMGSVIWRSTVSSDWDCSTNNGFFGELGTGGLAGGI